LGGRALLRRAVRSQPALNVPTDQRANTDPRVCGDNLQPCNGPLMAQIVPADPRESGSRADRTCGQIRRLRRYNACFGPHPRPRSQNGRGVTQAHACGIP
jgi:hypothetical protein